MSNLQVFGAYAGAFEESLLDDNWARLEKYFADDASYKPGDGSEGIGRAGAIQSLQHSVNQLERRCDTRELIGEPTITETGDTITLGYVIKYKKEGHEDFLLVGTETIEYVDGLISKMEDIFEDPEALLAWQASL